MSEPLSQDVFKAVCEDAADALLFNDPGTKIGDALTILNWFRRGREWHGTASHDVEVRRSLDWAKEKEMRPVYGYNPSAEAALIARVRELEEELEMTRVAMNLADEGEEKWRGYAADAASGLAMAVAEEREACAKEAEWYETNGPYDLDSRAGGREIAAAIRARGRK